MLMKCVDCYSISSGARGLCQCLPPCLVAVIANPGPVNCTQDNWILFWHNQHQPNGAEWLNNFRSRLYSAVAEGAP